MPKSSASAALVCVLLICAAQSTASSARHQPRHAAGQSSSTAWWAGAGGRGKAQGPPPRACAFAATASRLLERAGGLLPWAADGARGACSFGGKGAVCAKRGSQECRLPSGRARKARMAMARGESKEERSRSESPPAREWSQVVSFSPEFCSLCQAQFEVLVTMLEARRCALYFRREDPLTGNLEFVPAAVYPEHQRVWVVGEGPEGRPSSGRFELPGFISAENLMPDYPFNRGGADGTTAIDISEGGLSVPVQYGNMVIGMLAVWRDQSSGKEAWTTREKSQVSKVASSLALAVVLDQRNQYSYNESLNAESLRNMLSETLHQVKNSLSAVRLFGKLLLRRLPGDDLMNRELAKDILIQSDRMVELLVPYDANERRVELPYSRPVLMLGGTTGRSTSTSARGSGGAGQSGGGGGGGMEGKLIEPMTASVTLGPEGLFPDIAQLHANEAAAAGGEVSDDAGIEEDEMYERLDKELGELRQSLKTGGRQKCVVEDALSPVISACQAIAEFDQVALDVVIDDGLPEVKGDARVLQEAMSNVLDNALKYCKLGKGKPSVKVHVASWGGAGDLNEGGVEITVEDSGLGVDPTEIPLLCSRGFRGRASLDSDVPGTGLGLHIVRELVFVMGGDLAFENVDVEAGGGLRVKVTLYS